MSSFLKSLLPSGKIAQLTLVLLTTIAICWLFLAYGHGELIEEVLLITMGGVAGGGGALGYQRMNGLP